MDYKAESFVLTLALVLFIGLLIFFPEFRQAFGFTGF